MNCIDTDLSEASTSLTTSVKVRVTGVNDRQCQSYTIVIETGVNAAPSRCDREYRDPIKVDE